MGECEGGDLIPLSTLSSSDIQNTEDSPSAKTQDSSSFANGSSSSGNTQDSPAEPEETRRQKCKKHFVLSCLFMTYLLVSAAYSTIAPFYPQEVCLACI